MLQAREEPRSEFSRLGCVGFAGLRTHRDEAPYLWATLNEAELRHLC